MIMIDGRKGGYHQKKHETLVYLPGSYVDIESLGQGSKSKLTVRCTLQADGTVRITGDAGIVANLEKGFEAPFYESPKFVTPADGVTFLLGLQAQFESAYVVVSEIKHPGIE